MKPLSEQELREKILKDYKVSKASVTISQKIYSNNTVSPVVMKNQDIVEIGIDDLIKLILSDRKAWGEYVIGEDNDVMVETEISGRRYLIPKQYSGVDFNGQAPAYAVPFGYPYDDKNHSVAYNKLRAEQRQRNQGEKD